MEERRAFLGIVVGHRSSIFSRILRSDCFGAGWNSGLHRFATRGFLQSRVFEGMIYTYINMFGGLGF